MKIGLLTFHDTNNFGSYLQTYGLYKKVVDLGYDCEIIDYKCKAIIEREHIGKRKLPLTPRAILKDFFIDRVIRKKYAQLFEWLTTNAKLSKRYEKRNISEADAIYDKFLVGSDIVWGMDIIEGDTTYFLDFVSEDKKKLAFASSIGNPWNKQDKVVIAPLLKSFSAIAVREEESAQWVDELTGIKPDVVCDPTMLLTAKDWTTHSSVKYDGEKYVLVYFFTKQNINDAKRYAKRHGLRCYALHHGLPIKGFKSVRPTNLGDFLSLFRNAAFVFTASYHGMLFSIYFNRQFAYYNRAHKSRMNTLARKLHIVEREGSVYDVMNMTPINYILVNKAVEDFRNTSIEGLNAILRK